MSITLDDVEAKVWRFGAEPVEFRMEEVLSVVLAYAGKKRRIKDVAEVLPAPETASDSILSAAGLPQPEAQPEAREDVPTAQAAAQQQAQPEPELEPEEEVQWPEPDRECRVCGLEKPAVEFTVDRSVKSGRRARCKRCDNQIRREQKRNKQAREEAKVAA